MPHREVLHNNSLQFDDIELSSTGDLNQKDAPDGNGKVSGLTIEPIFTSDNVHPFEKLNWQRRTALIKSEKGEIVFQQQDVEFPESWSQSAVNVVASKYFHGKLGTSQREFSVKQLIDRVARTIRDWGEKDGYFSNSDAADIFYRELVHLLVNQKAAFNSPVWFNCGIEPKQIGRAHV